MKRRHEASVTSHLGAEPAAIFDLLTTVDRLPEWNAHIDHVVEPCPRLVGDAQWVVQMRAMGGRWNSRSWLRELDREKLLFSHRTQSDDGNPSYAIWTWQVTPAGDGADVTVSWQLNPKTFWREALIARVRQRQLKKEVRASLETLGHLARGPAAPTPP